MVLVFGCRQARIDHIYKEETLFAKSQGVFRELYTAYSREPDKPKVGTAPATRLGSSFLGQWAQKCAGLSLPRNRLPSVCPHPGASLRVCPGCSCSHPGGRK